MYTWQTILVHLLLYISGALNIMWFLHPTKGTKSTKAATVCKPAVTWIPMHICREQGHKSSCVQNHMQVFKWWSTFRFVNHAMVKCSNTVDEPTASVFTVANVVKVDGEAIQEKNCETQSSFRVSDYSHLQKAVPSQWELRFPRMALFSGFTSGINRMSYLEAFIIWTFSVIHV